ncbi:MAG: putative phosphatase YcdX [Firmicutes bacterium ADurb.Bin193]|nr:MAG: putative phosphatase YcdX [Firmicutes bacterium ADurb.Bin193]
MEAFAVTDHGPGVADGAHSYHFQNLDAIPRKINGVVVLRGAECNIQNEKGIIDLEEWELKRLDVVIASIHQSRYSPKSEAEHTKVLTAVMDNPLVHILGHIEREQTGFDIEKVVKHAKKTKKLIEVNAASLMGDGRIKNRCRDILAAGKKHDLPIVVTSDSHICYDVGNVALSVELLNEVGYDFDLVMNTSLDKIKDYLGLKI